MSELDSLLGQLAELNTLRNENALLKEERKGLERTIKQQQSLLETHTASWNVLVVMGQVTDETIDTFELTQGEAVYSVNADNHPCGVGDWVMVTGNLTVSHVYGDPDKLVIQAYRIEGVDSSVTPPNLEGAILG